MSGDDDPTLVESVIALLVGAVLALVSLLLVLPWLDLEGH